MSFTAKRWGALPGVIEYWVFGEDGRIIGKRKSYNVYALVSIFNFGHGFGFSFHRKAPCGTPPGLVGKAVIQEAGPGEAKPKDPPRKKPETSSEPALGPDVGIWP